MATIFKQPCDEAVITSKPAVAPCHRSAGQWILAAAILGSSMAFIDGTVVNVALPALQESLSATVLDVQWVVEAYALFLAALLLVGGSLGDRFGRRRIFVTGVVLFSLASAWCGFAPGVGQLIAARALQGVGGALLVPGSLAIISASFDEERRGQAIGTWSGFTAITAAVGPVLGGWLVQHVSWRAVFFINLPLGLAVVLISFWRVPESRDPDGDSSLDWWGAVLAPLALGALTYGLIDSSRAGFSNPAIVVALGGGLLLLAVFIAVEARSQNPILPLSLFRSRDFAGANLLTFFLYAALGGAMFLVPLNLIQVQGYSPTAAGAAFLPFILIVFLLSRWAGGLVKSRGARLPLVVGPIVAALGYVVYGSSGIGKSYWTTFFPGAVLLGLGMATSVAPLTTTVMTSVSGNRAGAASGINNAVSRTAGLLGVAIFGILILSAFNHELDRRVARMDLTPDAREALDQQRIRLAGAEVDSNLNDEQRSTMKDAINESFTFGFRLVMGSAAALALLSSVTAYMMIRGKTAKSLEQAEH